MKRTLSANWIKLIAIAAMTVDHLAWLLYPGYPRELIPLVMHMIGRITCPVMCWFIAEGYHHTRDINKYTARLLAFAVLSHFAYVLASDRFVDWRSFVPFYYGSVLDQTSVMWSLAWGLVMLRVVNSGKIQRDSVKILLVLLMCLISFPSDWSCIAALCIMAFGTNRGIFRTQMLWMTLYVAIYGAVYFFALDPLYGLLQLAVVLAIPVIRMYNGQRGSSPKANKIMKWVFYLYYPLHLLVIGWLKNIA